MDDRYTSIHGMAHQAPLLDQRLFPALRPLIRAYLLGYISCTVPNILSLLLTNLKKSRRKSDEREGLYFSLLKVLRGGLEWQRFPTFCAALVGGSTLLQIPLRRLFDRLASNVSAIVQDRLTRWVSTFVAAWFSVKLLQNKESPGYMNDIPQNTSSLHTAPQRTGFAGRTMDLTLFATTRALDVIVGEFWARRKVQRLATKSWTKPEALISTFVDPGIFATSSALIMWCFIYLPERLPRSYNKWISGAAAVDSRLILALNRMRWGELIYGEETGQAPLLQSMCVDYGWPQLWGDPARSIPFPCEMVHMGSGKSCEYHAVRRFLTGFLMAIGIYAPLNIAVKLRGPSRHGTMSALVSTARSSAFLGSFIALFYYGVCLGRTRIGPHLIGTDIMSRQMMDSGICIALGCALCGWSIFLENPGRRKDIALFVTPRALATVLPRRYELRYQWRETIIFAASTAVVFTCAQENPARVRGVLGKLLARVLIP